MQCRIADLRSREVINVCDGKRLGYISDILVDTACGRVVALVIPGPCRCLGLFLPGDDILIRWECVKQIGDDFVLVEKCGEPDRVSRSKRFHF